MRRTVVLKDDFLGTRQKLGSIPGVEVTSLSLDYEKKETRAIVTVERGGIAKIRALKEFDSIYSAPPIPQHK